MISSPCRTCSKRNMPKDRCMRGCRKITAIQELQQHMHAPPYVRGIDAGSTSFRVAESVTSEGWLKIYLH